MVNVSFYLIGYIDNMVQGLTTYRRCSRWHSEPTYRMTKIQYI